MLTTASADQAPPVKDLMTLTLFYAPNSCALASHIALEEARADYAPRRVDFGAAEQTKPDYLAINPKARVPALQTARGILTETPAILAFIAQSFPEAALAPLSDAFAFAQLQAFNAYLCATVHVAHAHRMRGYRWADDPAAIAAMQKKVPETVGACFELIEREMFRGPWAMGKAYTIADPLSVHDRAMAGGRRRGSEADSSRPGPSQSDARAADSQKGAGRRKRLAGLAHPKF